jgi:hypothetical protein
LTCAVLVLLLGKPSPVVALNVAEFVIVPLIEFCTRATSDSTSLAPLASEPLRLQVTVLPLAEHDHPEPENESNVTFGGKSSTIRTPDAASGPRFSIVSA